MIHSMIQFNKALFILLFMTSGSAWSQSASTEWNAAADSVTQSLIRLYWDEEEHYFRTDNDGTNLATQYWPQAHAMDVVIDAYLRSGDNGYSDLFQKWFVGVRRMMGRPLRMSMWMIWSGMPSQY